MVIDVGGGDVDVGEEVEYEQVSMEVRDEEESEGGGL